MTDAGRVYEYIPPKDSLKPTTPLNTKMTKEKQLEKIRQEKGTELKMKRKEK